jgi:DNA processing protein
MTEKDALIILNAVPGITNLRIRKLLECFGSAKNVFTLNAKDPVIKSILPEACIRNIFQFPRDAFLEKEHRLIADYGIQIVTSDDSFFPELLKEIPDAPVLLYVKGAISQDQNLSIAVVGSRRASVYGISIAEKFSMRLAELGVAIVSGMARGIDTAAHRGCLNARGKTFAVLGCGLSNIYPPENKELMNRVSANGAVISEFPMTMEPMAYNFPRRNRIISGLSLGVIVVEASARSGALITSRFALEQGKEVFAVPGKIDHPNSQGVNSLIKQGAKLVSCIEDVLEELSPRLRGILSTSEEKKTPAAACDNNLSGKEKDVYSCIDKKPIYIDELVGRCGETINKIAAILLKLELKHFIRQLPGRYYVKQ